MLVETGTPNCGFVSSTSNSEQTVFAINADFSGAAEPSQANGLQTNGQFWIGTTSANVGATHVNVGTLTSTGGTISVTYSTPNINIEASGSLVVANFAVQTGTSPVTPTSGQITFNGAVVAAGTHPVRTDGTGAHTMALEVQTSQALAASDATKIGLSNFNSAQFTVDANGFVSTSGSGVLNTLTPNSGTTPVVPTGGTISVLGAGSLTTVGSTNVLTVQLTGLTNHALQIGAGTSTLTQLGAGTTGQVLQTNTGADPTWSTATYPSTTTINQILYSSANNVVGGLATVNSSVLATTSTGVPEWTALTDGQLVIGSTAGEPEAATLTAGNGITITNAANSITIAANDSAFAYTNVNHAASPYTVLSTDEYISVDCSGGVVTLKFPNAPTANRTWVVKDRTGSASTSNISITTVGGSVTFDGQTTYTMASNYSSIQILANATPTYEVY